MSDKLETQIQKTVELFSFIDTGSITFQTNSISDLQKEALNKFNKLQDNSALFRETSKEIQIKLHEATERTETLLAEIKGAEAKSYHKLVEEEEKLAKEYSDLQKAVEVEKQKIHKRVTDQIKQIYQ